MGAWSQERDPIIKTYWSFHVLSVKKEENPAVETETLWNTYFPILSCKYSAKALLLTDKGNERLVRHYAYVHIISHYTEVLDLYKQMIM